MLNNLALQFAAMLSMAVALSAFVAPAAGATSTPAPLACCGDANGDGVVTQEEIQSCLGIGVDPPILPSPCDCNQDGVLTVGDIILAANNAVNGCPGAEPPTPSATSIATPTATPTPTPAVPCCGDCNGDGRVTVNELILAVNVALGNAQPGVCLGFDCGDLGIPWIIAAVDNALYGCPRPALPTPTVTP